jgi:hypothetical protein
MKTISDASAPTESPRAGIINPGADFPVERLRRRVLDRATTPSGHAG